MDAFGYTTNSKGYKVLPDFIRVVQGDGVRRETLPKVFMEMERRGPRHGQRRLRHGRRPAAALQPRHDGVREKANAVKVNGEWRDICKSPTGDSMKVSKKGRLALQVRGRRLHDGPRDSIPAEENQLVPGLPQRQAAEEVGLHRTDASAASARCPEYYYADYIGAGASGRRRGRSRRQGCGRLAHLRHGRDAPAPARPASSCPATWAASRRPTRWRRAAARRDRRRRVLRAAAAAVEGR